MPTRPHKLELYRWAVQHPWAEIGFLSRVFAHAYDGDEATLLREDFAGTSAVSMAWVAQGEDHRALAVERNGPTARWAERLARRVLGERCEDVVHVECDVLDAQPPDVPRVDVVAALNFSVFEYHSRDALRGYFKSARRSLRKRGVIVLDVFGGPGARRISEQHRQVIPSGADAITDDEPIPPAFGYRWEQRAFDAVSGRIDCRIHFDLDAKTTRASAFRYDWRLWTLPELVELLGEAGFAEPTVWCDTYDEQAGQSDGVYRPMPTMSAREDWVAYVVARR